jgi:NAD(P)-dependent dehydrogenase (short-subunit alcohol dehydrogenase family)
MSVARSLVTGASRGLGLGICEALVARGDEVLAACRRSTPALERLGVRVIEGIEVTDDAATAGLAAAIGDGGLDTLVCNAGVNIDAPGLEAIDVDDLMRAYDINALGAVRVVLPLLGRLNDGAKIVFLGTGSAALNLGAGPSPGNYGYRMSKAALVSFGGGLARDLRERRIAVGILNPGPVDTDQLREVAAQGRTSFDPGEAPSAREIGARLVERIEELTPAGSPSWQDDPEGRVIAATVA